MTTRIIIIIAVLTIISFFSCNSGKSYLKPFNLADIDSVIIISRTDNSKKLDTKQTETLITHINKAPTAGIWKFIGEYGISVYLKDHTQRNITTNADHFKIKAEKGDLTYTVRDKMFFTELYANAPTAVKH